MARRTTYNSYLTTLERALADEATQPRGCLTASQAFEKALLLRTLVGQVKRLHTKYYTPLSRNERNQVVTDIRKTESAAALALYDYAGRHIHDYSVTYHAARPAWTPMAWG